MKRSLRGATSTAFVVLLAFLIGLSVIMVSGTGILPSQYDQNSTGGSAQPGSEQIIVTQPAPPGYQNLQLRTFTILTNTPIPDPPATADIAQCGYESGDSSVKFDEPEIMVDYSPKLPKTTADTSGVISLWAGDESGIVLGAESVNGTAYPITQTPDGQPNDIGTYALADIPLGGITGVLQTGAPAVLPDGQPGAVDTSGRPLFPALFLTNITGIDPNSPEYRAGDWQRVGAAKGIAPHFISGTWVVTSKNGSQLRNSPRPNKHNVNGKIWTLAPGGAAPEPGKSYDDDDYYGAEIRWYVSKLTFNGQPLVPGNVYRAQFIVQDGDKSGSDVAQGCVEIKL